MKISDECLQSDVVSRFLSDALLPYELTELEEHLTHCESCREKIENRIGDATWWAGAEQSLRDSSHHNSGHRRHSHLLGLLGPTDDPESLGRVSSYEVTGLLGMGGMGAVFKAFDRGLNRFVAIKMLLPHHAESELSRRRFAREGQAAAAVVDDHVLPIHAVDEWQGVPYLVMQYVRGQSLQQRLDRDGPLSAEEVLRIGVQIARGLAAAHSQGLVHRDVKPSNILLDGAVDRAMLTDFGLARATDDATMTRTGMVTGTPQYMSPEQARAETADQSSDLFSIGAVLYAMCTGTPPFCAETSLGVLKLVAEHTPTPIESLNPDIPEWLCAIVRKLMSKHSQDRFQSASEVAETLEACLAHVRQPQLTPLPPALSALRPIRRDVRNRWVFWFAFAAMVAALWFPLQATFLASPHAFGGASVSEEIRSDSTGLRNKVVVDLYCGREVLTAMKANWPNEDKYARMHRQLNAFEDVVVNFRETGKGNEISQAIVRDPWMRSRRHASTRDAATEMQVAVTSIIREAGIGKVNWVYGGGKQSIMIETETSETRQQFTQVEQSGGESSGASSAADSDLGVETLAARKALQACQASLAWMKKYKMQVNYGYTDVDSDDSHSIKKLISVDGPRMAVYSTHNWDGKPTDFPGNTTNFDLDDGESFLSRTTSVGQKKLTGGITVRNREEKRWKLLEASGNFALEGHCWGNEGFTLMQILLEAKTPQVATEKVGSHDCLRISDKNEWGTMSIWIDEGSSRKLRKLSFLKERQNRYSKSRFGEHRDTTRQESISMDVTDIQYATIGKTEVAVGGTVRMTFVENGGKTVVGTYKIRRTNIELSPEFEPSVFEPDFDEGARIADWDSSDRYAAFRWIDGILVSE